MVPNNNIISNLVYNTEGRNVESSIINGKTVMENRKLKYVDTKKTINKFVK